MSAKISGLVWDLDNAIIARYEKYVLLCYADHADHEGRNIFPSIRLIQEKTGYKERAAQAITHTLEEKGFLVADGRGPHGTNKWRIPLDEGGAKIAPVQKTAEGVQKTAEEGATANAPKPSLDPSLEPPKGDLIDGMLAFGQLGNGEREAALVAFESAFGFGTLPWGSNTVWTKFQKFIAKIHKANPGVFVDYVKWRKDGGGKYGNAMTNVAIRRNPQEFMDTGYPTYEASKIYHHDKPQELPESLQRARERLLEKDPFYAHLREAGANEHIG